jgi:PcfJ-like protein
VCAIVPFQNAIAMLTSRSIRETNKRFLDEAIHAAFRLAQSHNGVTPALERLLFHVYRHNDLLRARRKCGNVGDKDTCPFIRALLALALHHSDWLRLVETWTPRGATTWPKFTSLARHLFAKYPIPAFMTSVWFGLPFGKKLIHHEWYKRLGRGASVQSLNIPLVLTKRMAHWFLQAPDHYSAMSALRWAQVRGMGGIAELAAAVAATRLSKINDRDDFWITALQFFTRYPRMDLTHVGPIVDFLYYRRFHIREVFVRGVLMKQQPLEPEFSMKGRTLRSMLRLVNEWHKQLGKQQDVPTVAWRRCKIGEFQLIEGVNHLGNMRRWTITELLNNVELLDEGRRMRHCVATYAEACSKRRIAIWSLRVENNEGLKPVLTIETDLHTKTVCQIRGRCNRLPKAREKGIIGRWATQEGMRMPN